MTNEYNITKKKKKKLWKAWIVFLILEITEETGNLRTFFFFFFLGLHLQHMEVPRLGDQTGAAAASLHHCHGNARSNMHLPAYTTVRAMQAP